MKTCELPPPHTHTYPTAFVVRQLGILQFVIWCCLFNSGILQAQEINIIGPTVHIWMQDSDPLVFSSEGIFGVNVSISNFTTSDNCQTQTSDGSTCSWYDCTLEFDDGFSTNTIGARALSSETWTQRFGVSTLDEMQIHKHLGEGEDYYDPFYCMAQYIAADLNGDGEVTEEDQDLLHLILLGYPVSGVVPTWNYFWAQPYATTQEFRDALFIYEPNDEAYYSLWDEYNGAFNHYDGSTLVYAHANTGLAQQNYAIWFYGIKIGDVNFSYVDEAVSCLVEEEMPDLNEFTSPDRDQVLNRSIDRSPSEAHILVDNNFTSIVEITLPSLSKALGVQLYLTLDPAIEDIELLGSDLPGFNESCMYFNKSSHTLNIVWIDYNHILESEQERLDYTDLIRFKTIGKIGDESQLLRLNPDMHSCVAKRDLKEYTLNLEVYKAQKSDSPIAYPNPYNDVVHFNFPSVENSDVSAVRITLYNVSGQVVLEKNSLLADSSITIELDDAIAYTGLLFYEIHIGQDVFTGRLISQ